MPRARWLSLVGVLALGASGTACSSAHCLNPQPEPPCGSVPASIPAGSGGSVGVSTASTGTGGVVSGAGGSSLTGTGTGGSGGAGGGFGGGAGGSATGTADAGVDASNPDGSITEDGADAVPDGGPDAQTDVVPETDAVRPDDGAADVSSDGSPAGD